MIQRARPIFWRVVQGLTWAPAYRVWGLGTGGAVGTGSRGGYRRGTVAERPLLDDAGGVAGDYGPRRDILVYDRPGPDDRAAPDPHAGGDKRLGGDPDIVLDHD